VPFVITNVLGIQTLLGAALRQRLGRFMHVPIEEVYGLIESWLWTEEWPLAPQLPVLGVERRL
jgi:dTDP-D-glucose 4,6-dehydratase